MAPSIRRPESLSSDTVAPTRRPRWFAPLGAVLVAGLIATGCGSDSDDAAPETTAAAATSAGDGGSTSPTTAARATFPLTVEHSYGSTEIEAVPERIVSLDPQWTDVLLALGITPVGFISSSYQSEPTFPWQEDLLADSTQVYYDTDIPMEDVAALAPDLIVGTYAIEDETIYDTLNQIAPTVANLSDSQVDPWQDIAQTAGQLLDLRDEATALVASVDLAIEDISTSLPGLAGQTIVFANYLAGDSIVLLTDPEDGANTLFRQLGLSLPETLMAESNGESRLTVSPERVDLLSGDILLILANGADPSQMSGWATIPAVVSGNVEIVDMNLAVALNTPTPLSVPWALDSIIPVLERAAAN